MKRQMRMAVLGACLGALAPIRAMEVGPLGDTTLEDSLRQSGWEVRRVEGEGLRLYPPHGRASAAAGKASVPAHRSVEVPAAGTAATQTPPGMDLDALRRVGWRIERAADGSTLLYPPAPVPQAPASDGSDVKVGDPANSPTPTPAPRAISPVSDPPAAPMVEPTATTDLSFADLEVVLRGRGWQVERDRQGSLVLRPKTADLAPQAITPSQGFVTAPVREEAVKLPVSRWVDARAIADAWVAEHGEGRLQVGKIRQVHRVYLVSIVGVGAPKQVVHQIAITGGNGHVVVLN
jgi:hypothetical protein